MIKTTELMLGNLVEFRNKYVKVITLHDEGAKIRYSNGSWCYCLESEINPIPLTEGVLKRLGAKMESVKSVHELQNNITLMNCKPLDITPLLSPRYTTHDGVEVWEGDEVWSCVKGGTYSDTNNVCKPQSRCTPLAFNILPKDKHLVFSTLEACQSYIDSVTRKPIFTTEDGVDVFEGDSYWYVRDCGYLIDGKTKSSASLGNAYKSYQPIEGLKDFSSPIIAQAYLNKVWAEKEYNDLLNTPRK